MVEALAPLIEGARLKLYCVESNISRTWLDKEGDPRERLQRHAAYERFVLRELHTFIEKDCRMPGIPLACAGASLGGLYAALFALKFPRRFRYALCLSGRYETSQFLGGYRDQDAYFDNPLAFVPNLQNEALEQIREHTHLALVCGRGPYEEGCIEETLALAELCRLKGIPHDRDIWGLDVAHHWRWWQRQAVYHLMNRYGR
jgi:esterase/lipase superfamily enzyme